MSLDYETFRQHQERYEREKADREDAEKWRKHVADQATKKPEKKEPEPHKHNPDDPKK